jgi:CRP-like cAMP-binding protein
MKTAPKKFLHTISVMAGLDEEALRFLYALAREEHYPAGGIIVGEGEPGNRMFFIASGSVAVVKIMARPRP